MHPHGFDPPFPGFEDVDPLSLEAFRAFRDAMKANAHSMARRFSEHGAHMGQAACLRVLDMHDGIAQRDMADALQVSRPNITAMLQAMEKGGMVVRKTDETDQRLTRVFLTEEGRKRAVSLRGVLRDYVNETFAQLSEDDRREIVRLMDALKEKIGSASCPMEREADD